MEYCKIWANVIKHCEKPSKFKLTIPTTLAARRGSLGEFPEIPVKGRTKFSNKKTKETEKPSESQKIKTKPVQLGTIRYIKLTTRTPLITGLIWPRRGSLRAFPKLGNKTKTELKKK